jgi:hypothetical protein
VAYLYNYVGKPEKTKEKVHFILENFYKNDPDGLIGNEDCGQMSAWYVLSAMGIYDVTPGDLFWEITEPFIENIKVVIDGKKPEYINQPFEKTRILPQFSMDYQEKEIFPSIIPVPVIQAESKAFRDQMMVEIFSAPPRKKIVYLVHDIGSSTKNEDWKLYTEPIIIDASSEIITKIYDDDEGESYPVKSTFFKKPNNYTIDIKSQYNPQYHAGGPEGLLDGIYGNENWRKGEWQGYQTQDFEAVVDLQTKKNIQEISANFLQDTRAWIVMPTEVSFYVSDDNVSFQKVATIANTIPANDYEVQTKKVTEKLNTSGRYVKVIAKNFGKLPEWHQGFPFDGEAFIFIDEILVE